MSTVRQEKIGRLLQKEFAIIFLREANEFGRGIMITVTAVRMSPDLSVAKIYLSIFGITDSSKIIEGIKNRSGKYRWLVGNRVKKQLRIIPELLFYLDDSIDYVENIERLLSK